MYSAAFIFEPGTYDDKFYALDKMIHEVAESMQGFVGRESWQSTDGSKINATYYWDNEESLKEFSLHPKHMEAKRQYTKWYKGYHIVISKIERSYGDSSFAHFTPNTRAKNA